MKPTLGGAVSTNIHGKNNVSAGTFAEHVLDLDIVTADGNVRTLAPEAPEFWAVCGGLGLLGIITRVRFKLRKVVSGNVRVVNIAVRDWSEHSDQFEKYRSADYCVGWVDGFGRGRGVFQAAWHVETDEPVTMTHAYQDHFGRVGGLIPRNEAWKWMRLVTNRAAIRAANQAKWFAAKALPGEKFVPVAQYNFQLDYLPDWERAYVPMGLLQFQCCVPAEHAPHVFSQFESRWRQRCLEPFLIVMKQHRADPTVLRYLEDGFSVALDFRMTRLNTLDLQAMYQEFAEVAIDAGGHVYFAKDGVLRKDLAMKSLGEDAVSEFAKLKQKLDPDNRFRTALSDRIGLTA
jgi:FAD/FMN-containing dehydrogenase